MNYNKLIKTIIIIILIAFSIHLLGLLLNVKKGGNIIQDYLAIEMQKQKHHENIHN